MATLKQCDRCKETFKHYSDFKSIRTSDDEVEVGWWEICRGCQRDFDTFMRNMTCGERKING